MSKLTAAFSGLSLTTLFSNPVASIETGVINLVKSIDTNYAELEPELDQAVDGAVPLVLKVLKVYAFGKVETVLKEFLGTLSKKYPTAAPEIQALISKLP